MAKNKASDLRDHLFETLERLKDDDKPLELDRAKAICDVSGKLIDLAKVEVQMLKAIGTEKAAEFFDVKSDRPLLEDGQPKVNNGHA